MHLRDTRVTQDTKERISKPAKALHSQHELPFLLPLRLLICQINSPRFFLPSWLLCLDTGKYFSKAFPIVLGKRTTS